MRNTAEAVKKGGLFYTLREESESEERLL